MAKELADFRQGDTKRVKIDYGAGVDITGYKFWLTLRSEYGDPVIVAQASSVAGTQSLDDVLNGIAFVQLESDVTKLIPPGKYVWDVQRVVPGTSPPDVLTLAPSIKNFNDKVQVFQDVTIIDV